MALLMLELMVVTVPHPLFPALPSRILVVAVAAAMLLAPLHPEPVGLEVALTAEALMLLMLLQILAEVAEALAILIVALALAVMAVQVS